MIRTGLVFNGTEKITVGGGEALWLYINKVLVVEIISTGTATCHKIDLSPAATSGPITLKCLSIGTPNLINFPFVSNGKLFGTNGKFIIFRCPNT